MALDRTTRLREGDFAGNARLYDGTLARHLRKLVQSQARAVVEDLATGALTDSSGGSAGADVADITIPPVFDASAAGGATPASVDAAADTVMDAYATLVEKANIIRAELTGGSAPEGPGTAGGGTISAITVAVTTTSGDTSASQESVAAVFSDLLDAQRNTLAGIDELRSAVGLASTATASTPPQGKANDGLVLPDPIADAALVTPGASDTEGVAKADIDTALGVLADNVALMADQLDAVSAITLRDAALGVVAL